jgi:hypothetical protein
MSVCSGSRRAVAGACRYYTKGAIMQVHCGPTAGRTIHSMSVASSPSQSSAVITDPARRWTARRITTTTWSTRARTPAAHQHGTDPTVSQALTSPRLARPPMTSLYPMSSASFPATSRTPESSPSPPTEQGAADREEHSMQTDSAVQQQGRSHEETGGVGRGSKLLLRFIAAGRSVGVAQSRHVARLGCAPPCL